MKKQEIEKIKINFNDEFGVSETNIFKRVFASVLKKYDRYHNGIVTAENFCNSIRETDELLRLENNVWGVEVISKEKCSVTSPIIVSIMNLIQITEDKYVNCKPFYLDVERIESVILVKNPYNESTVMVTHIRKTNLEKDHVKYSVKCPKMYLEDLYPPALESTKKYTHKTQINNIFDVNIQPESNVNDNENKLPSLRALPSEKLDDFRKLYAMWNKCMLSDEDFIIHMKKDLGIENIPREFLFQVSNKGPSRTLSYRDAICSLFINDIDSLRRYRPQNYIPEPGRMSIETRINPITHEDTRLKYSQKILNDFNNGYGKVIESINNYNDEIQQTFKSKGKKHRPLTTLESNLKHSLECMELNTNNNLNKNCISDNLNVNDNKVKYNFVIDLDKLYDEKTDKEDTDKYIKSKKDVSCINSNKRITVTMPEVIQMQLKKCVSGETTAGAVREYLKHYGIPITVTLDTLLRRNDEDGTVSFTSLMKEVYNSIKNMQTQ
ncbi:Pfa-like protein [Cryptosporidium xiaoi]|uniref:Pfa-like protein n=1 Tax=Cryptosporidium xiaoi TaxID=659607 RepID=A0AAV9Y1T7_9CRYT